MSEILSRHRVIIVVMKYSQKGFIFYVATIVLAAVLALGLFFYFKNVGSLWVKPRDNAKLLLDFKLKTEAEVTKLEELNNRHDAEGLVINQIQQQYSVIRNNILNKTDGLFQNPNSENPKIKVKISDKNVESEINLRRREITKLLDSWDAKSKIINSNFISENGTPTLPDLVKSAKSDIYYVQKYISELQDIVNGLSPENSNLTRVQINSYITIVEINTQQIEEAIYAMASMEYSLVQIYQPSGKVAVSPTQNQNNLGGSTSTAVSAPTPSSISSVPSSNSAILPPPPLLGVVPPIVTQLQIQAQQDIVAEAKAKQAVIEQKIAELTPSLPPSSPALPESLSNQPTTQYYPNSIVDHNGWTDLAQDTNSGKPLLLDGANKP